MLAGNLRQIAQAKHQEKKVNAVKKFDLGTVKVSPTALDILKVTTLDLSTYLTKHQNGEWGDTGNALRLRNEWALKHNGIIRSEYKLPNETTLIIITNTDRSFTSAMLETEYQGKEVSSREGYALWARSYDHEINPLIAIEEPPVDLILDKLIASKALDAGTGTGRYARKLAKRGFKVSAVDQSPEMLEVAEQHAQEEGLLINFQHGSLESLPFKSKHFELVVCGLVLCHIPSLRPIIGEFMRVTKDGGYLLITDFHPSAVAAGGRTVFTQAESWYMLPNINHTRKDYLNEVEAAGYTLLDVIDLYLRDMPDETIPFYEGWVRDEGDQLIDLIIFAQKVATAD